MTPPAKKLVPHAILFALTVLTMLVAGAMQEISGQVQDLMRAPELLSHGVIYTLGLLGILLSRDLAHWLVAHSHDLHLSIPWYLPAPTLFGTLGSFVTTARPPRDRRALFDVAAAGPLAAMTVAIPMAIVGILWSEPVELGPAHGGAFNEPLVFAWLIRTLKPDALDTGLRLHPFALAAWTGMLVTAMSLLPVGQLDGGHLAYAVFAERQQYLAATALAVLVVIGVVFESPLWIVWALILLLLGYKHPPMRQTRETSVAFGAGRIVALVWCVVLLVGSFSLHPSQSLPH